MEYYSNKFLVDTLYLTKDQMKDKKVNLNKEIKKLYGTIKEDFKLTTFEIEKTINEFYLNLNSTRSIDFINRDLEISKKKIESKWLDNLLSESFFNQELRANHRQIMIINIQDEFITIYEIYTFILKKYVVTTIEELEENIAIKKYLCDYENTIYIEGTFENYINFSSKLHLRKTEFIDNKSSIYNITLRKIIYGSKI